MAIDPQRVGAMAMEFMERLEQKYGEDADLETLVLIAVVDQGNQTTIEFDFRTGEGDAVARHVGRGIVAEVDRALAGGGDIA